MMGRNTQPLHDSSLQRSQLTGGEITGALATESLEEFFGCPIGFGLEPGHHARPRRLEGILARPPVSRWLGSGTVGGADLPVSPRIRQTLQEAIEISIPVRQRVDAFARGESGEMMLNGSNFIEQTQWIQRSEDGPQSIFHRIRDGGRGQ